MKVFKIRCCNKLHRIGKEGDKWFLMDHGKDEDTLHLLAGKRDIRCYDVLSMLSKREIYISHDYIRPYFRQISVGNSKLINEVIQHAKKGKAKKEKKLHKTERVPESVINNPHILAQIAIKTLRTGDPRSTNPPLLTTPDVRDEEGMCVSRFKKESFDEGGGLYRFNGALVLMGFEGDNYIITRYRAQFCYRTMIDVDIYVRKVTTYIDLPLFPAYITDIKEDKNERVSGKREVLRLWS